MKIQIIELHDEEDVLYSYNSKHLIHRIGESIIIHKEQLNDIIKNEYIVINIEHVFIDIGREHNCEIGVSQVNVIVQNSELFNKPIV